MEDLLYHYTTIETLEKIMQDFKHKRICLRATHAKFLNDPQEYLFASRLFKDSLKSYEESIDVDPEKSLFEYIFSDNEKNILTLISEMSGNPYLVSFSSEGDALTMWRNYAKNGYGVCIGFDKKMLSKYCKSKSNKNLAFLLECDYLKLDNWNELMHFWAKYYHNFYVDSNQIRLALDNIAILTETIESFFRIKEYFYSEEKEFRICFTEHFKYKIRNNGNVLIPYIEHYFNKKIIKKIVIGPCLDKDLAKKGIEMFLTKHGYTDVKDMVEVSKVSYRQI